MNTKYIGYFLAFAIATFIFWYLCGSFIAATFFITQWDPYGRYFMICAWVITLVAKLGNDYLGEP